MSHPSEDKATPREIEAARNIYQNDDVEIDEGAAASRGDDGVWVAAWVWVNSGELEEETDV